MADICLVAMPMAAVERPSMALGLLKAHLERAGLSTRACHANLWYLDYIGLDNYHLLNGARPEDCVIDWLFSGIVFPGEGIDEERFLDAVAERSSPITRVGIADWRRRLAIHRRSTSTFVDWAADRILANEPKVVGCTSTFQQHLASVALLRRIRERAPDVVTMLGGANCETVMGATTHRLFPWIDYVCSGEADDVIVPLMRGALDHGRGIPQEELPSGIFAPRHRTEGYPRIAAGDGYPRNSARDMATMPVPSFDDYFADRDDSLWRDSIRPGLPIETSRGCWWGEVSHCTFCGLNGGNMAFRSKSPEQARAELEELSTRHGVTSFEAVDNILDMTYIDELMPGLAERDPPLRFFFEVKANLKREQVARLAAGGVTWVQPGIESLDSGVLALIGKGAKAWANVQLLKWCRQYGIRVGWNLIVDFPGEDDAAYARMAELIPLLHHLQPGAVVMLRYDRFSPYFTKRDAYGLELRPSALYGMAYPLDEATLSDLVYFFENRGEPAAWSSDGSLPPRLADRDGLAALRRAHGAWGRLWRQEARPQLLCRPHGDGVEVTDTRAVATAPTHRLDALESAVLARCDDAPPEAGFVARAARELELTESDVERVLDRLLADRLVVRLDRRYLGLPLQDPVGPLRRLDEFPGGTIAIPDLRRSQRAA